MVTLKKLVLFIVLSLFFSMLTVSLRAESFFDYEKKYDGSALVTTCGMNLLLISDKAGNLAPVERAKVVAERLNYLFQTGNVSADALRVGYYNGQVVLEYLLPGSQPYLIVTVDSNIAKRFHGADGSRTTLAYWWLAMLRDHMLLAEGREPLYTVPYGTGYVFERIYMEAVKDPRYNGGPISMPVLMDAITNLNRNDPGFKSDFERLYSSVPSDFTLSSANNIDTTLVSYTTNYASGPSFYSSGDGTTVPGPAFDEANYVYNTSPIPYPVPTAPPQPPPQAYTPPEDDSSVSYTETTSYPQEEPVYYEDYNDYSDYNDTSYYPPPDLPEDAPQSLPPDFLVKNLKITPNGTYNNYLSGSEQEDILKINYVIMDSNKEIIDSEETTEHPFECNLKESSDASFLEVNITYKDGYVSSILYQLNN